MDYSVREYEAAGNLDVILLHINFPILCGIYYIPNVSYMGQSIVVYGSGRIRMHGPSKAEETIDNYAL